MLRRTWGALLGLAAIAAAPANADAAGFAVLTNASASTYAAGHITGKSWTATFSGGDVKSITFAQPIYPQIDTVAAATLVNPAYPAGQRIGTVSIQIIGAPAPAELPLETGDALKCAKGMNDVDVAAPPSEFSDPVALPNVTGLWRVDTHTLGLGFPCVGIRIDATAPIPSVSAGVVKLKIDITPIANTALSAGLHLAFAKIGLDNVHLPMTLAGPKDLFADNPLGDAMFPPWSIVDTITATPCLALAMHGPCDDKGTDATSTITETVGGQTGVTASLSASKITYGSAVTISGFVTRGTTPGAGEEVDVLHSILGPLGLLDATPLNGAYSIALHPTKSGAIAASAWSVTANRLYSSDVHVEVVAPKPTLAKKVALKLVKGGAYNVTVTVKAVSGITYTAKFGAKALTATKVGTTVVFTGKGLKLKKGSSATVTASATGITRLSAPIKLK